MAASGLYLEYLIWKIYSGDWFSKQKKNLHSSLTFYAAARSSELSVVQHKRRHDDSPDSALALLLLSGKKLLQRSSVTEWLQR